MGSHNVTCLASCNRHKWTHPSLIPASEGCSGSGTRYTYSGAMEGWVDLGGSVVTYRDGLPGHRRSPIQVLTEPDVECNFDRDQRATARPGHRLTLDGATHGTSSCPMHSYIPGSPKDFCCFNGLIQWVLNLKVLSNFYLLLYCPGWGNAYGSAMSSGV